MMDWKLIYSSGPDHVSIHDCPEKKAVWLTEAKRAFPVGTEVLVKSSADVHPYIGWTGKVKGYDTRSAGVCPMIEVEFGSRSATDGFYEDEITKATGGDE